MCSFWKPRFWYVDEFEKKNLRQIITPGIFFLDFGIEILQERVEKTNFPWLMSNVIDNETGQPLADGKVSHIIDWCGRKIGLVSY